MSPDDVHHCTECPRRYTKQQFVDQHMAVDHGTGPALAQGFGPNLTVQYSCRWLNCAYVGKSGEALANHVDGSVSHVESEKPVWECKWEKCGHKIKGTKGIARKAAKHISASHIYWLCEDCYSTFKRQVDYERHKCRIVGLRDLLFDATRDAFKKGAANRDTASQPPVTGVRVAESDVEDEISFASDRMIEWREE